MASVDAETESVVVRIVYDGPPTAGKTTSLQALADRFGQGKLVTPETTSDGRTLFFDWLEYVGGRFDGRPIRCQLVSVPGQKALSARRRALLATADAVVFVGDSTASGAAETQAHLDDLLKLLATRSGPPVGVVLQANKRDLPDAVPLSAFRGQHGLGVIASIASRGEGIREAFVFAVRLALDRVRELVSAGALEVRRGSLDAPGELLSSLRSLVQGEGAEPGVAVAAAGASTRAGSEPRVPDATIPSGWISASHQRANSAAGSDGQRCTSRRATRAPRVGRDVADRLALSFSRRRSVRRSRERAPGADSMGAGARVVERVDERASLRGAGRVGRWFSAVAGGARRAQRVDAACRWAECE
ncbi:MAG: ADP-ribosylation factor-like protein [Archangium sp.]